MSFVLCGLFENSHRKQHPVIGRLNPVRDRNAVVEDHSALFFTLCQAVSKAFIDVSFICEDLDHLAQRIDIRPSFFKEEHLVLVQKAAHDIPVAVQDGDVHLLPITGFLQLLLKLFLIEDLADPDHRLRGLKGQLNGSQDDIEALKQLRRGRRVRHCFDLYLAVDDPFELYADQARRNTPGSADHGDAERPALTQMVFFQEDAKIGSEMPSLVLIYFQPLILFNNSRCNSGHLIRQREFGL